MVGAGAGEVATEPGEVASAVGVEMKLGMGTTAGEVRIEGAAASAVETELGEEVASDEEKTVLDEEAIGDGMETERSNEEACVGPATRHTLRDGEGDVPTGSYWCDGWWSRTWRGGRSEDRGCTRRGRGRTRHSGPGSSRRSNAYLFWPGMLAGLGKVGARGALQGRRSARRT